MCEEFTEKTDFHISSEEILKLTETITESNFEICFVPNNSKLKVMTVFASKGLEFNQVVAFGSEYNLDSEERLNAHYVAVTRAKEKMVMIDSTNVYTAKLADIFIAQGAGTKLKSRKILQVINR